jgi:hypothetical protein
MGKVGGVQSIIGRCGDMRTFAKGICMVESLCHEIYTSFLSDTKEATRQRRAKTNELGGYFFHHSMTYNALKQVCELERKLIHVKGTHKVFVESQIFYILTEAAMECVSENPMKPRIVLSDEWIEGDQNTREQHRCRMAFHLVNFAREIFSINKARDAFNIKRKVLILELLMALSYEYDIPEAYEMSLSCLQSRKSEAIWAACEYLETSCKNNGQSLGKDAVELLGNIIGQAKDPAVVAKAVHVQQYA